jgi:hypothetical protein
LLIDSTQLIYLLGNHRGGTGGDGGDGGNGIFDYLLFLKDNCNGIPYFLNREIGNN